LLDNEPRQLLKGYTTDQLHELWHKVHEVGGELDSVLDEADVQEILGAKMEDKTLWFYVRWGNNECSFIPAQALNHFAPAKVIQYYEGLLQFQPGTEKEQPPKQTKPPVQRNMAPTKPQPQLQPRTSPYNTMNCSGCDVLLQYPEGTKAIKCPVCNTIMIVNGHRTGGAL
jgi:LSD1 subclass zinc finger protein